MFPRSCWLIILLLLCPAPEDEGALIQWRDGFDEAFLDAKKSGRPVFIVFHADEKAACRKLYENTYCHSEVVALSKLFICLAASLDEHDDIVVTSGDGLFRNVCARFPNATCSGHQAVWARARTVFLKGDAVQAPGHLFIHPRGHILESRDSIRSPAELKRMMKKVLSRVEPLGEEGVFSAVDDDQKRFVRELARLNSVDPSQRRFILEKLVRWKGEWVYPRLEKYFSEAAARPVAVHLLREIGFRGNERGCSFLLGFAKHKDRTLRLHAAVSLEEIALPETIYGIRSWLKRERDSGVYSALLRALAASGPGDSDVAARLEREVKSKDPLKKRNAAVALGIVGCAAPGKARPVLEDLAAAKDPSLAACACWALGWMRSKESLPLLKKKMEEAGTYRMIILLEDAIHRVGGRDTHAYHQHLEKYAGDEIIRNAKWPPKRSRWGL